MNDSKSYLFGGNKLWDEHVWITSDDRVRGGKSQSYLTCSPESNTASFHGTLDISALGGAGFASQRTIDSLSWDLTDYQGISLGVAGGDGKKYTLILKDEVLPKRPDGREQSTVSWEYDFVSGNTEITVSWGDFRPTYRGRPKPDADPLRLDRIKRISIMMRRLVAYLCSPTYISCR
ncbi:complex I intermediate-associated protein 30 [Hypomontagnella monticulosa]|nr:complex I intermediate-associated protein 30 [Hypomontagnella monticulosa]